MQCHQFVRQSAGFGYRFCTNGNIHAIPKISCLHLYALVGFPLERQGVVGLDLLRIHGLGIGDILDLVALGVYNDASPSLFSGDTVA